MKTKRNKTHQISGVLGGPYIVIYTRISNYTEKINIFFANIPFLIGRNAATGRLYSEILLHTYFFVNHQILLRRAPPDRIFVLL